MMTPNAVSPMVMPTLRAPVASVPGPDLSQLGQQEQYKRSESRASAPRDGPSRNESRQSTGRRASDASSMLYTITVEPPVSFNCRRHPYRFILTLGCRVAQSLVDQPSALGVSMVVC